MDLIVYDGVCVLCSRSIRFVTAHDPAARFRFVPLQSPYGRQLAERYDICVDAPDTFVAVIDGAAAFRSQAWLNVMTRLPGYGWTGILRVVPQRLRDAVYDLVARNRYRWFGRTDRCERPPPDLAARVIEDIPASEPAR
jgi:predicted DCC family thiol-disulfide oxidoreductase YuxK